MLATQHRETVVREGFDGSTRCLIIASPAQTLGTLYRVTYGGRLAGFSPVLEQAEVLFAMLVSPKVS